MLKIILIFLISLPLPSLCQSYLLKPQLELIDTKIDSIHITNFLLNEPSDKNFTTKFKVLEFWATWCKPCLKAVPHLNKLQQKFKDSNIVFLSFTYERPENTIQTFNRIKFETIVVTDTTKAIHRKLRIEYKGTMALPRTVLIDNENNIVWYGSPEKLNAKLIDEFLNKKRITK